MPLTLTRRLRGRNARNWPGLVIMDPRAPLPAAVWAQECYEAGLKLNPVNLIRVAFSKAFRREMEIMGHEIETQAAVRIYGRVEAAYRRKEARVLTRHPEFKGWGAGKIERAMRAKSCAADKWVARNIDAIRKRA